MSYLSSDVCSSSLSRASSGRAGGPAWGLVGSASVLVAGLVGGSGPAGPGGAVAVGGGPSAGFDGEGPAVFVDEAVVEPAQQRPVGCLRRAALVSVFEVVDVAVPWRPGAGREGAVPVAGGDGPALSWGPGLGGVVGVEDVAFAVENGRAHV